MRPRSIPAAGSAPELERRHFLQLLAAGAATATLPAYGAETGMLSKADGANYAPKGKPNPVVKPGEFVIAAAFLDHGHITGQCNGLTEAGARLKWVFDPDPKKVAAFQKNFPAVQVGRSLRPCPANVDRSVVA